MKETIKLIRNRLKRRGMNETIKQWAEGKIKLIRRPWEPGDGEETVIDDDVLISALIEAYHKGREDAFEEQEDAPKEQGS